MRVFPDWQTECGFQTCSPSSGLRPPNGFPSPPQVSCPKGDVHCAKRGPPRRRAAREVLADSHGSPHQSQLESGRRAGSSGLGSAKRPEKTVSSGFVRFAARKKGRKVGSGRFRSVCVSGKFLTTEIAKDRKW